MIVMLAVVALTVGQLLVAPVTGPRNVVLLNAHADGDLVHVSSLTDFLTEQSFSVSVGCATCTRTTVFARTLHLDLPQGSHVAPFKTRLHTLSFGLVSVALWDTPKTLFVDIRNPVDDTLFGRASVIVPPFSGVTLFAWTLDVPVTFAGAWLECRLHVPCGLSLAGIRGIDDGELLIAADGCGLERLTDILELRELDDVILPIDVAVELTTECDAFALPCVSVNAHGRCVTDPGSLVPTCACAVGYVGDGVQEGAGGTGCREARDRCVYVGQHWCHAKATCAHDVAGKAVCTCTDNMIGTGHCCVSLPEREDAVAVDPKVATALSAFWTQRPGMVHMDRCDDVSSITVISRSPKGRYVLTCIDMAALPARSTWHRGTEYEADARHIADDDEDFVGLHDDLFDDDEDDDQCESGAVSTFLRALTVYNSDNITLHTDGLLMRRVFGPLVGTRVRFCYLRAAQWAPAKSLRRRPIILGLALKEQTERRNPHVAVLRHRELYSCAVDQTLFPSNERIVAAMLPTRWSMTPMDDEEPVMNILDLDTDAL